MKKRILRLLSIIISLPVGLILLSAGVFVLINRTNGSLVSSKKRRTYLLYVPKSYNAAVPTPLVISIHGYAEWPAHQMEISHWNQLADENGFIVVYPSGTQFPLRWRIRGTPGDDVELMKDVNFISALIDKLSAKYNIDPMRIYANGLSNGGGMSFVLSCKLSERIAAFGSVSGAYLLPWNAFISSRPVPAIIFHGTADPIVPFQGGPSASFNVPFPAIPEWVEALAKHYGCESAPETLLSMGAVSGIQYTHCAADVVFYTINGGGHSWPGGTPIPKWIVGTTTKDIDATRIMWNFFVQHPLSN
jgi:polyhydroxybutyrate depolymerase